MKKIYVTTEGNKIELDFNNHFRNLVKINESLNMGARKNYKRIGLTYVDVPELVGITGACENVDTLFKIGNRLSIPLFFIQTGQLSLEQALQSLSGVFTVINSGRDEEEEDERHLRQFRMTEEEFDCTLAGMTRKNYDENKIFESLLLHIQSTVQSMIEKVLEDNIQILKRIYRRNISALIDATKRNFLRINYEDAVGLLQKNGFQNLKFGDDLKAEHEAKIVTLLNKNGQELPIFICKYPKEIKFFNMKVSTKDPRVVLSADLIFPYAGEGTGSAVREHDFDKLNERLMTSTMYKLHIQRGGKYEDFKWYLDIIRKKLTNPHAGYGIGNERVLQFIFGESDIRNVSLFSLLNKQTGDWEKGKKEQLYTLMTQKKSILLSIGKIKNKKRLLPKIKSIGNSYYLLCSTSKTHGFLKRNGIISTLVYKISEVNKKPNLADLLNDNMFDIIINIPTRRSKKTNEFTDGQKIRQMAIEKGATLITDVEVAETLLTKLGNGVVL